MIALTPVYGKTMVYKEWKWMIYKHLICLEPTVSWMNLKYLPSHCYNFTYHCKSKGVIIYICLIHSGTLPLTQEIATNKAMVMLLAYAWLNQNDHFFSLFQWYGSSNIELLPIHIFPHASKCPTKVPLHSIYCVLN